MLRAVLAAGDRVWILADRVDPSMGGQPRTMRGVPVSGLDKMQNKLEDLEGKVKDTFGH